VTLETMAKILFLAVTLGLDAFAVSIGIGAAGVTRRQVARVGLVFGAFESLMPVAGLMIGRAVADSLGRLGPWIGCAALLGLGVYTLREALAADDDPLHAAPDLSRGLGLLVAALTVSLDALGVGFGLALLGLPIVPTLIAIAACAFLLTGLGLAFGAALGDRVGSAAEVAAGLFLMVAAVLLGAERLLFG
jgi:putative Mn2+ efflux pump MntP